MNLKMQAIHQKMLENTFIFECQKRGLNHLDPLKVFRQFQLLSLPHYKTYYYNNAYKHYLVPFFALLVRFRCFDDSSEDILRFCKWAATF